MTPPPPPPNKEISPDYHPPPPPLIKTPSPPPPPLLLGMQGKKRSKCKTLKHNGTKTDQTNKSKQFPASPSSVKFICLIEGRFLHAKLRFKLSHQVFLAVLTNY